MCSIGDRKFWEEFIALYKSFPCLWDIRSKSYMDRNLRNHAMDVLIDKCKEINSMSNKDFVNKKIHNLRCSFRRELNKVKRAKASGKNVYVPSLWYFDNLSFITNCDDAKKGENFNDADADLEIDRDDNVRQDDIDIRGNNLSPCSEVSSRPSSSLSSTSSVTKKVLKRKRKNHQLATEMTNTSLNDKTSNSRVQEDWLDITGKKIAYDLRELNERQRIIAEKLISDVIFYAKLDKLNENYSITDAQQTFFQREVEKRERE